MKIFNFHRGAKSKDGEREMSVPDPNGLIKWVSSDRCLVTPGKGPEIAANRKAVEAIIKAWVKQTSADMVPARPGALRQAQDEEPGPSLSGPARYPVDWSRPTGYPRRIIFGLAHGSRLTPG